MFANKNSVTSNIDGAFIMVNLLRMFFSVTLDTVENRAGMVQPIV